MQGRIFKLQSKVKEAEIVKEAGIKNDIDKVHKQL